MSSVPHDAIAERFVTARKSAKALDGYPGEVPAKLEDSYAIQEAAIKEYDRPIVGWKIGRLAPDKQPEHGTERLAGPIFAPTLKNYADKPMTLPVYVGGFAAVEAEYLFRVGKDADPAKTEYSEAEALQLIDACFAGIEMAGSPLATINALGPTVVVSDFGNNFGVIVGPQLLRITADASPALLDADAIDAFSARTEIDGKLVGKGGLFTMPGGPLKAIAWLAGHLAGRGRPLTKGQLVSSGATTGIHDIGPDQSAVVTFVDPAGSDIVIRLQTVALTAQSSEIG
jgi:2-keto-4-pentenoate hydratase